MIRVKYSWLIVLLAGLCWGCQETEVLETYEQVKETTQPVPIVFNPYVLSQPETSADTRADLSYLSYIDPTNQAKFNLWYFKFIPCLGLKTGTGRGWASNDANFNYRFGTTATNSYIVGVYAFSHSGTWSTSSTAATANVMSNQPLLRVPDWDKENETFAPINAFENNNGNARRLNTLSHWDYEPKKYWPVGEKVTFISYYPYQDYVGGTYYRAGVDYPATGKGKRANEHVTLSGVEFWDPDDKNQNKVYDDADLTCITPPAADATGTDAYTFKFRQLNDVQKHIDFLLGIKTNQTKEFVTDSVGLQLKHTLCGVQFNFETLDKPSDVKEMKIIVNSIGFKGLYTKGEVCPVETNNSVNWSHLANYDTEEISKYGSDENANMVNFEVNTSGKDQPPFMKKNGDDRPTFTYNGSSWTSIYQYTYQIYNNTYNNSSYNVVDNNYGGNSRGFRYLLLVIPQTVNDNNKAYLEVDYDLSYTTSTDQKVSFKNTVARIRLSDSAKKSGGDTSQLFIANKMLVFNVKITPAGIDMDVQETDWEDEEERQLPIEKENGN